MRSKISCLLKIGTSYVVSLFVIYYIHVRFFPVNVVFYAAIADGVIATLLTALLLKSFKSFEVFNNFEKLLILFICLIGGYSFAVSVPTIIDRSLSFYILLTRQLNS